MGDGGDQRRQSQAGRRVADKIAAPTDTDAGANTVSPGVPHLLAPARAERVHVAVRLLPLFFNPRLHPWQQDVSAFPLSIPFHFHALILARTRASASAIPPTFASPPPACGSAPHLPLEGVGGRMRWRRARRHTAAAASSVAKSPWTLSAGDDRTRALIHADGTLEVTMKKYYGRGRRVGGFGLERRSSELQGVEWVGVRPTFVDWAPVRPDLEFAVSYKGPHSRDPGASRYGAHWASCVVFTVFGGAGTSNSIVGVGGHRS
ncbi:hypothetical protein DFH06DRAFT_1347757 [Mycena polygramma]|nr:hypothetical protein DFH06DRAFT_1347757 [Mycena polygramma]